MMILFLKTTHNLNAIVHTQLSKRLSKDNNARYLSVGKYDNINIMLC